MTEEVHPLVSELVIVSPHVDDAWFCLSGLIDASRLADIGVQVVDVFSIQSWTMDGNRDRAAVTQLRHAEEEQNARRDNVTLIYLDLEEAQLRGYSDTYPKAVDWTIDSQTAHWIESHLRMGLLQQPPMAILFPMGIGLHVDHTLLRHIGERLLRSGHKEPLIAFYEDLPYAIPEKELSPFTRRLDLVPVLLRCDLDHKRTALAEYRTQIDSATIDLICAYASSLGRLDSPAERLWVPRRREAAFRHIFSAISAYASIDSARSDDSPRPQSSLSKVWHGTLSALAIRLRRNKRNTTGMSAPGQT